MGADLVQENRGIVAQQNMTVVRLREFRIDQLEAPEPRANLGGMRVVLFAEFGGVAISDDGELAKVAGPDVILGRAFDTENLLGVRASDQVRRLGLDNTDIGAGHGGLAQLHDKPAVVKAAALWRRRRGRRLRVGDDDGIAEIRNIIPLHWDRVDALQTIAQTKLLQSLYTARLQQFAHDAIWLFQQGFQENDAPALSSHGDCERAAQDPCAYNHEIGMVVFESAGVGRI